MKRESNKERAYDLILNDIIRGEFQNERVLNERGLIERYQIGKTPIREALVELCNENVLRSIPRYGYEVLPLTQQDVNDVLQFRCIVECACLRRSAARMSHDAMLDFKAFADAEFRRLDGADVWEAWESNVRVHLRLLSYGGNRYIQQALRQSMGILKRAYAHFYWVHAPEAVRGFGSDLHQQIAEALLAGDIDAAAQRLEEDIVSFEKLIFTY